MTVVVPEKIKTATTVLARAYELLEQGWCQHRYRVILEGYTSYCLSGAIYAAGNSDSEECITVTDEIRTAVDQIVRTLGTSFIATWNDTPGRTQKEVLALVKDAIDADEEA